MRSIARRSLHLVAGLCLLSGCYRPMMSPQQQGYYGGGYSGGGTQSYGGYQGIQTLTPGQYYAPGTSGTPTYAPNGLQPTPEGGTNGMGGSSNGGGGSGGDAPVYNPGTETPRRPVPTYDGDDPGGLQEPASDGTIRENNSGTGQPSVQLQEVPAGEWPAAEHPIEQTGLQSTEQEETEEVPSLFAPVP